jgi:putative tryptophan/tyrosine transport system substrate-binding protein
VYTGGPRRDGHMRRRELIAATAVLVLGTSARAQTNAQMPKRIAIVDPIWKPEEVTINGYFAYKAYLTELNRLAYVEGENLIVERYLALGRPERHAEIARAAVASHPDLIFAPDGQITRQLKTLTTTIPVIALTVDPVASKIVTNLARPEGNITGVSVDAGIEIWGKRLELLREATQKLTTVAVLYPARAPPYLEALKVPLQQAGARFGISVSGAAAPAENDRASYERTFDLTVADGADGLMVGESIEFVAARELIVELVARHRLPAIYCYSIFVEDGGLMSYGIDIEGVFRRAADMTVDVLRGGKPGDIPFYQQTKFELALNRTTARSLGLEFPPSMLGIADEVID